MANHVGAFGLSPFSAKVSLWLVCGNQRIDLSHVGPGWIVAAEPASLPECNAQVIVCIDGEEHARDVRLSYGMNEDDTKTAVELIDVAPF